MAGFMKKYLRFKTRKWRRQFVEPQLLWCQTLPIFAFSHNFICKRESSSLFFVGFVVVVEEFYTSVACDFGYIWAYNVCFLQLADCCFSCTGYDSLTFFSLTSRLVPSMDCFHYVTYGIFALRFSLNQIFVIKFSVSFATVVERTRPSHVFILVFARQKT